MTDKNFGIKQLYEVVFRAKTQMRFGDREFLKNEPVLVFKDISMMSIGESASLRMARGGWLNSPRVIWEDRSEMAFSLSDGVMNQIGQSILTSSKQLSKAAGEKIYIHQSEYPLGQDMENGLYTEYTPSEDKSLFVYEYENDLMQKRVNYSRSGKRVVVENGDNNKDYLVDYYYEYGEDALTYLIDKSRLNCLFSFEGKFYSQDENEGVNVTNLLIAPKVKIVSDINLQLGERANPITSVFNMIVLPEKTEYGDSELLHIIHQNSDVN